MNRNLPLPSEISSILGMLFDKVVQVKHVDKAPTTACIASYISDQNEPLLYACIDLPGVAYIGAALSQIPAAQANELIKTKKLEGPILESFREVINILANSLNTPNMPHVRLAQYLMDPQPGYKDMLALANKAPTKVHLSLSIPGYGNGTLSFFVL